MTAPIITSLASLSSEVHSYNNLPVTLAPLIAENRWLVWRWEPNRGKKLTKVPYRADRPNLKASSTDAQTWSNYSSAVAAVDAGSAHGIGFALHGSTIGAFDLDHCRNPKTGEIASWAVWLLQNASSYAEITPSGRGLRILGVATGPEVQRSFRIPTCSQGVLEVYRKAKRYITISGQMLPNVPKVLASLDAAIDWVVSDLSRSPRSIKTTHQAAQSQKSNSWPPEYCPVADNQAPYNAQIKDLPSSLRKLVELGPPPGSDRSVAFHHAVCWLKAEGWSINQIEVLMTAHPNGVADKYSGRVRPEIERSWSKAAPVGNQGRDLGLSVSQIVNGASAERGHAALQPIRVHWHRDADPFAERPWLIRGMIAQLGKGLLSGQWGSAKTFIALDLCGCIMTGEPFAGRSVLRRGGVLFVAPEGASEVPVRLRGLVRGKIAGMIGRGEVTDPGLNAADLPFAWIEECPRLVSLEAAEVLIQIAEGAATEMKSRYGLPLALIVVDTVAAGAGFEDENSAAETQKLMSVLERLAQRTETFVLGVDHFGKTVETGTRGSSAKEAAADTVLAALADRDTAGHVKNMRLAVRKVRGANSGQETPYTLSVVEIGEDRDGAPITTCVVNWQIERTATNATAAPKDRWPTSLKIFRNAMRAVLVEGSQVIRVRPLGSEGIEVAAVPDRAVRAEFCAAYPADGETEHQRADAKRNAYNRARRIALEKGLIGARDHNGSDYLWLVHDGAD